MSVGVGDKAPDFSLPAHGWSDRLPGRLRRQGGGARLLPGRRHAGVHEAAELVQPRLDEFETLNAQVLGISAQGVESHETFAGKHGFKFPLLADTDKSVAGLYGTLGPLGFPRRSVFIVDGTA